MKSTPTVKKKTHYATVTTGLNENTESYIKVIAENIVEAKKILLQSKYSDNLSDVFNEKNFIGNHNVKEMNALDVFSQFEKDYILECKNDEGFVEKDIITEDELFDMAERMWPCPEEEYSEDEEIETARINYLEVENGGESKIVEMLREYKDYVVIDLDIERKKEKLLVAYKQSPKVVSEAILDAVNWGSKPLRSTMQSVIKTHLTDRMVERICDVLFKEEPDAIPSVMQESSTDEIPNNTQKP